MSSGTCSDRTGKIGAEVTCSVRELIPIAQELLERGQRVRLTATGGSMWPFLHDGDHIELAAIELAPRVGDILLARVDTDSYVLHRLCRCDGDSLYLLGDSMFKPEGPLTRDALLGQAVNVERGQNWRALNTGSLYSMGRFWLLVRPLRRPLLSTLRIAAKTRRRLFRTGQRK